MIKFSQRFHLKATGEGRRYSLGVKPGAVGGNVETDRCDKQVSSGIMFYEF